MEESKLTYLEKLDAEIEAEKYFFGKKVIEKRKFDNGYNRWYKLTIQATSNIEAHLQVFLTSYKETYCVRIILLHEPKGVCKCFLDETKNLGCSITVFNEAVNIGHKLLKELLKRKA